VVRPRQDVAITDGGQRHGTCRETHIQAPRCQIEKET
jgi:hypothetical protein